MRFNNYNSLKQERPLLDNSAFHVFSKMISSSPEQGEQPKDLTPNFLSDRLVKIQGFSLIEVVIALGIVSFAVSAILGLIPTGLNTLKDSNAETVRAQIVRSIAGSALTANFSSLNGTASFDSDGQPIPSSDTTTYPRYTVSATTNAPSFPGSAGDTFTDSLTALKIQIVLKPASGASAGTNTYTLHIANSGK